MKNYWHDLTVVSAAALALLVPATSWSGEYSNDASVYPPTAKPYGKSYSEWTAEWWKWALAQPVAGHPFTDPGFQCNSPHNGQAGPVWFLASAQINPTPPDPRLPPDLSTLVQRSCTIPAHTAILIGLANAECSTLEGSPTEQEQRTCARFQANHVVRSSLICVIDGQRIKDLDDYRFASPQFRFHAPTPWIFGATGGTGKAVADGYFVMLKPLSKGTHTLSCGGKVHFSAADLPPSGADFAFGNTYYLTVQGGGRRDSARPGDNVGPRAGDLAVPAH
jgi:hypothetical protein